jgi:cytochrome c oxidase subunit II
VRAQDIFSHFGPQARHILDLWWLITAVCAVVFLALLGAFLWALWRGSRGGGSDRHARAIVGSAVGVSTLLLLFLIVASVLTDRALAKLPAEGALTIEVTGHRWWWELRYEDERQPARQFITANEMHIPVGRPIRLKLKADDVIHSFWVPSLHGKKDLIPGRDAELLLRADQPGEYRGQCAEFCGVQHAKMALIVVAHAADEFEAWAAAQRQGAPEPQGAQQTRGRDLFVRETCAMCHAVQGTQANGRRAPDLTHLAGRRTLGAGALPNEPGTLQDWIKDPHQAKPGVNMPAHQHLKPDELQALAAWLGSLK